MTIKSYGTSRIYQATKGNLTPDFLAQLKNKTSLYHIASRFVPQWDKKRSNPGQQDWWAPCPFHHEKTSSFHVDEKKGFYHCFGCGAHGDSIKMLSELGKMTFIEAVEELCHLAGVEMPKRHTPAESHILVKQKQENDRLYDIMQAAWQFFHSMLLEAPIGHNARQYLEKNRHIQSNTIHAFGIGYAPPSTHSLRDTLKEQGFTLAEMKKSGLITDIDDGSRIIDKFRDRIVFPIHDHKQRVIAFGGRALSKKVLAKYLNSPETPLFSKRQTIYNLYRPDRIKTAQDRHNAPLICEGYMDVISLHQAGFTTGLATMGTALSEEQLKILWQHHNEPIFCLDGDQAGFNAAMKVAEIVLSHLAPGRSVRFCVMPQGYDPDDIIKSPNGIKQMQNYLTNAWSMVDFIFAAQRYHHILDTPEQIAAFSEKLMLLSNKIPNSVIRYHYQNNLKQRLRQILYAAPSSARKQHIATTQINKTTSQGFSRKSHLNSSSQHAIRVGSQQREYWLAAALCHFPQLLEIVHDEFCELEFTVQALVSVQSELLSLYLDYIQENNGAPPSGFHHYCKTKGFLDQSHISSIMQSLHIFNYYTDKNELLTQWRSVAARHRYHTYSQQLQEGEKMDNREQRIQNLKYLRELSETLRKSDHLQE